MQPASEKATSVNPKSYNRLIRKLQPVIWEAGADDFKKRCNTSDLNKKMLALFLAMLRPYRAMRERWCFSICRMPNLLHQFGLLVLLSA